MKSNLLDFSYQELAEELRAWGEPGYRARQVWDWVWRDLVFDFSRMTNLPLDLRQKLSQRFEVSPLSVISERRDYSGTEKRLFSLSDGDRVEAVLVREGRRRTVCLSTQVGCPGGCLFCATGKMGFIRNLSPGEIAAQVLHFERLLRQEGRRVTHIVVMGMGEPLLNYDATLKALLNLNDPRGLGVGARRITISTVGIVPAIYRLAQEGKQFNLAISLHAPTDELRRELVPLARDWSLAEVLASGDAYALATGRRLTYEYVLLSKVNDDLEQARELARLLQGRLAHVNLIPFNPFPGLPFSRPGEGQIDRFRQELLSRGIDVTVRYSRGVSIQGGCGQLSLDPY